MKKLLLVSTATAALLAGATLAMSQNPAAPPAATAPSTSAPTAAPPANKPSTAAPSDKKPGVPPKGAQREEQPSAPKAAQRDQQQPPKAAQPGRAQAPSEQAPGAPSAAQPSQAQTPSQSNTNVSVNLTTEQRTTIRSTVLKGGDVPRAAKIDFQINVGGTVPRSVRVVQLPATVIQIHPAWRGYLYFVVGDEIVIVEPGTMRIVAVVAA
jgi:outer membrane biosynthesis protein TonB